MARNVHKRSRDPAHRTRELPRTPSRNCLINRYGTLGELPWVEQTALKAALPALLNLY